MKAALVNLSAVALGGAMGASLRYMAAHLTHQWLGRDFPYGTLMVNVVGSLVIGYLLEWLPQPDTESLARLFMITGLLGGFTTYSAFSIETLYLVQDGQITRAGMNIILTLLLCFMAVWAGYVLGKLVHVQG